MIIAIWTHCCHFIEVWREKKNKIQLLLCTLQTSFNRELVSNFNKKRNEKFAPISTHMKFRTMNFYFCEEFQLSFGSCVSLHNRLWNQIWTKSNLSWKIASIFWKWKKLSGRRCIHVTNIEEITIIFSTNKRNEAVVKWFNWL